jgi:thiamine biosynthesis lipoprotein
VEFEAIGTHWQIDLPQDLAPAQSERVLALIEKRIADFDKNYSRFREDSLVSEMARTAGTYTLPEDAKPLLDLYKELYDLTGGLMTPLIGQVLVDAGYDATYSLVPKPLTSPPAWDEVLDYHYPTLTLKKPVLLDFGAAGKGYLIDIIGEILTSEGIQEFTIDAGGDILHKGNEPIRIGLENPTDFTEALGVVALHNASICGSAGNRRAWAQFHHIIDPVKLTSPRDILALWVVADSALIADGLATALFFVDYSVLTPHFSFEFLLNQKEGTASYSAHFPAELFIPSYDSRDSGRR